MRIAGITKESTIDGLGINYVIYVQGCPHKCEGCHNPSTWDVDGGYKVTIEELMADIVSNSLITGVTFSGGDPVEQFWEVNGLAVWCKEQGLQTTLYTGYTLRKFRDNDYCWTEDGTIKGSDSCVNTRHLKHFDYIIDGRFEIDEKSSDCPFRGSTNQRMLKRGEDF